MSPVLPHVPVPCPVCPRRTWRPMMFLPSRNFSGWKRRCCFSAYFTPKPTLFPFVLACVRPWGSGCAQALAPPDPPRPIFVPGSPGTAPKLPQAPPPLGPQDLKYPHRAPLIPQLCPIWPHHPVAKGNGGGLVCGWCPSRGSRSPQGPPTHPPRTLLPILPQRVTWLARAMRVDWTCVWLVFSKRSLASKMSWGFTP